MSVSFAKYKKLLMQPLALKEQDEWREKFAADVVKLAEESEGRDDILKRLHDATEAIGHNFVKLGSGATRAVFALPLGLVAKLCAAQIIENAETRPALSPNAAELERSKAFPAFIPRVYGECYRSFGREDFDQTIDLLVVERIIPLGDFTDHITRALGSTNSANLGVCPRSGRLMALDVGEEWAEGAECAFMEGTHPLMQAAPFMRMPRW